MAPLRERSAAPPSGPPGCSSTPATLPQATLIGGSTHGANDPITKLDIEGLNALGVRLFEHADAITNAARRDIASDLRLAAVVASRLSSLRFRISEIASRALDRPEWDAAAFARDIRAALDDAAKV